MTMRSLLPLLAAIGLLAVGCGGTRSGGTVSPQADAAATAAYAGLKRDQGYAAGAKAVAASIGGSGKPSAGLKRSVDLYSEQIITALRSERADAKIPSRGETVAVFMAEAANLAAPIEPAAAAQLDRAREALG